MAKTKAQKNRAIIDYFEQTYGSAPTLATWQAFCRDIGVDEGNSIRQCKKLLKSVNVNIVDFVSARKSGQAVFHFASRGALARYMEERPGKIFPLKRAKEDSFLKMLLIQLF